MSAQNFTAADFLTFHAHWVEMAHNHRVWGEFGLAASALNQAAFARRMFQVEVERKMNTTREGGTQ
jgi:hypothetical protein